MYVFNYILYYDIILRARDARESDGKKSELHSTIEDVSHASDHDATEQQCTGNML